MGQLIFPFEGQDLSTAFTSEAIPISTNVLLGFIFAWGGVINTDADTKIIFEVNNVSDIADPGWDSAPTWQFPITDGANNDGFRGLGVVEFKYVRYRYETGALAVAGNILASSLHLKEID